MKIVIEKIKCDVCGAEKAESTKCAVVFVTEQTEGRSRKPYLEQGTIDLCDGCRSKMLDDGKMLFAEGAQGYNRYFFKGDGK